MSTNYSASRHYGVILTRREVAGLTVTENAYAPRLSLPRHAHERACFCLVRHGSYTETYQRKSITCEPLSLIFRPAGEVHADQFGNVRVRCFIIEFDAGWLDRVRQYRATIDGPTTFRQSSLVWLAARLRKEIKLRMDALTPLVIEGLLLEMMAEAARHDGKILGRGSPHWLARAERLLKERLTERLTLAGLAQAVGVHPVYLACAFRRHYGWTVGEYVRQLRGESDCRELSTSSAPLTQVALAAGFADQSQFSRSFKRITGLTPTEYRKTFRAP